MSNPNTHTNPVTERFIRLPEVQQISGMGKTSIYAAINAGRFPAQYKITGKNSAWRLSEVMAWMDSFQPQRNGGAV